MNDSSFQSNSICRRSEKSFVLFIHDPLDDSSLARLVHDLHVQPPSLPVYYPEKLEVDLWQVYSIWRYIAYQLIINDNNKNNI